MMATLGMFLQVKIGTFYFKIKSLDFNLLVKSTKVTRVSQFWSRFGCRCAVWPASVLLPNAMIKWFFDVSSWVFFCCLHDCDVFFRVMIFEMKGPNMMKNQPSQTRSSLPIWWLFAFLVYFKMFLKFLSLVSAFLARKPNSSFLNNCHDLMTKRLPNSSAHFKQRSFIIFDHANVLSFHAFHYFI